MRVELIKRGITADVPIAKDAAIRGITDRYVAPGSIVIKGLEHEVDGVDRTIQAVEIDEPILAVPTEYDGICQETRVCPDDLADSAMYGIAVAGTAAMMWRMR